MKKKIDEFIKRDFKPRYGRSKPRFTANPIWNHIRNLGTELWLDTGNIDDIRKHWTQEFSAVYAKEHRIIDPTPQLKLHLLSEEEVRVSKV